MASGRVEARIIIIITVCMIVDGRRSWIEVGFLTQVRRRVWTVWILRVGGQEDASNLVFGDRCLALFFDRKPQVGERSRFSFGGDDDTLYEELITAFCARFRIFFHRLEYNGDIDSFTRFDPATVWPDAVLLRGGCLDFECDRLRIWIGDGQGTSDELVEWTLKAELGGSDFDGHDDESMKPG